MSDLGRFSNPGLLVLVSVAAGAKHGYAIQQDIETLTNERLGPGTLYGAIRCLEERGLMGALPPEDRRRPYQLTTAGRQRLRTALERARSVTSVGLRRLAATTIGELLTLPPPRSTSLAPSRPSPAAAETSQTPTTAAGNLTDDEPNHAGPRHPVLAHTARAHDGDNGPLSGGPRIGRKRMWLDRLRPA